MKVLLGITGSVAATLTPKLVRMLVDRGHEVQVVATEKSLYFFRHHRHAEGTLLTDGHLETTVKMWTDKDEWTGDIYQKDQAIPHIALAKWADVFAIVPITANTIGKMAHGICDNLLTSVVMAWSEDKQMVLAPAMNTKMWNNNILQNNLNTVIYNWKLCTVVEPVEKRLACGDVGQGALASLEVIVDQILNEKH